MRKPFQLIVFDWEGTLGDTLGLVIHSISRAAIEMQLSPVMDKQVRELLPLGLSYALTKLFPTLKMHEQEFMINRVQEIMMEHPAQTFLFDGAKELIEKLSKASIELAIASNRGKSSLQKALKSSGMEQYFRVTRTASEAPAKPSPVMLQEIMEACHVKPENTLMIGDSVSDIEMAKSAGVQALGVNFYQQTDQVQALLDAGSVAVLDDFSQIETFLNL